MALPLTWLLVCRGDGQVIDNFTDGRGTLLSSESSLGGFRKGFLEEGAFRTDLRKPQPKGAGGSVRLTCVEHLPRVAGVLGPVRLSHVVLTAALAASPVVIPT